MDEGEAYPDEPTIADDAVLWRRIHPIQVKWDDNRRCHYLVSGAFSDSSKPPPPTPMSAFLADESGGEDEVMRHYPEWGLVAITAGQARELGLRIARTPDEESPRHEPGHVYVAGRKPDRVKRALRDRARWVRRPRGYDETTLPDPN
jgi:hypothetical protein